MTEHPAPVADIMDAESVRAELAEVEARAALKAMEQQEQEV